jgi:hypothetical protein
MRWPLAAILCLLTSEAFAQSTAAPTTPVTPTGTLSAQVTMLCWESLAVNTNTTLTCTPPPNQYGYITAIYFDVCANNTGATVINNVAFTSTGLPNTPSWPFSFLGTANTCHGHWGDAAGGAVLMKSSSPGVAFTIVPPAISATNAYEIRVYGYFAP